MLYSTLFDPSPLFDSSLLLREADKPAFADVIWNLSEPHDAADIIQGKVQYVLDYVKRKYKDAIVDL